MKIEPKVLPKPALNVETVSSGDLRDAGDLRDIKISVAGSTDMPTMEFQTQFDLPP
jgi:hypothetical protein